jgi:hypothetical protein
MYPWISTAVFVVLLGLMVYYATSSGIPEPPNVTMGREWGMR